MRNGESARLWFPLIPLPIIEAIFDAEVIEA